jgi:hypothetical protein
MFSEPYSKVSIGLAYVSFAAIWACQFIHSRGSVYVFVGVFMVCYMVKYGVSSAKCNFYIGVLE